MAPFRAIAEFLGQVMADKDCSEEEFLQLLANSEADRVEAVLTYLGWHLANCREKDLAKKYLTPIAGSGRWTDYHVLYAQLKLRELGVSLNDLPLRYNDALQAQP